MADIFLDTNILLRLMEDDLPPDFVSKMHKSKLFISVLSVHIAAYVHKVKLPSQRFSKLISHFKTLPLTNTILNQSLLNPINDFEDNVQLNTALKNNLSTFITLDKELLKMKNYKSVKIIAPQEL